LRPLENPGAFGTAHAAAIDAGGDAGWGPKDPILERRSVRRYSDEPIPPELIRRVMTAACAAPSAHNRQPWRFVVISSPDSKQALAKAMGARLANDRRRDGDDPSSIAGDVERSRARLVGAPLLVLVCLTMEDMDAYPDERRRNAEYTMAVQSVAMAGQNLLIASQREGLGSCWLCAPLFCPDVPVGIYDLPSHWLPQGLITLGYPRTRAEGKPRKPLMAVSVYR
jgi:coenzyme F420-0:L-glutamate ligase/coenzyme F420-1:gamma-L-glutamate ligase